MSLAYTVVRKSGNAKAGLIKTIRGEIKTPVFMPVGTQATVKALSPEDLRLCGVQIILANTYHLYLRPGHELISQLGGLHQFMGWPGPILTDSGGYQVSSLGHFRASSWFGLQAAKKGLKKAKIDDKGVTFYSHLDGSRHRFTPEKSIKVQQKLKADIVMAFDEATPDKGKRYALEAMERTHHWLKRSLACFKKLNRAAESEQAVFGIIQGGNYKDLRRRSAEFVVSQEVDGVAVGGGSIGQDPAQTEENVSWIRDLLPENKPVYLMGVGVNPEDVIAAVNSGADMFDCVAPTRLARMGQLYNAKLKRQNSKLVSQSEFKNGRLNIGNSRFRKDAKVIQTGCDCYTCSEGFSRSYLRHLFLSRELLYYRLASLHNVRFMVRLTEMLRRQI